MSTDFFAQQDAARRRTGLLIFYFFLATLLIIVAVYSVVAATGVFARSQQSPHGQTPSPSARPQPPPLWDPVLFGWVSLGTLAVIFGGSAYKTAELNFGGESVARMLGGRRVNPDSADPDERKLLNVVEEMAIASGSPVPTVYVLDNESAINAFAAGFTPGDAVIGVTRGAIELLTRDELQGVMAHEFSHIFNGDMRLNIRLIGILHGILLIALIGYVLIRTALASSGNRSRSRNSKDGGGALALVAIGAALVAIGYIGVFFGRLIKSAVSRQREFLADASAVQFTRNPDGIAGALKKIGGLSRGSRIADAHAEEASHMFFGNAVGFLPLKLLSTHPPLEVRIKRIDPSFDGTFPKVQRPGREEAKRETRRDTASRETQGSRRRRGAGPISAGGLDAIGGPRLPVNMALLLASIGEVQESHLEYARSLLESLPGDLRTSVHQPPGAQAAIYLLLLDRDPEVRDTQQNYLDQHAPADIRERMQQLKSSVKELSAAARVPLVEMTFPALRTLSLEEYTTFRRNVKFLVEADRRMALFEYTLQRMLQRHLDDHFAQRKPTVVQYFSLRPLLDDCAALLSALAYVGNDDDQAAADAFHSAARTLEAGNSPLTMLPRESCRLKVVDDALTRLAVASPQIKKRVLTAALACVSADRQITTPEAELLRAIADSLDCPLPPLVLPDTQ